MNNKPTMDENHVYRVNGQIVPSVSSLLVEVGLIDENVIKFADPSLGSAVHKACELDDDGILDEDSCCETVMKRVKQWRKCKKDNLVEVILNEVSLYSKLGYCGTPDKVFKYIGDSTIYLLPDIKTSKVRSKSTKVQLAFYKKLVEENLAISIDNALEVVLHEDKYEIIEFENLNKEASVMKSILNIHYYKKG